MAKWELRFTEEQARRVAEKLFPECMPPEVCPYGEVGYCDACQEDADGWDTRVQEVWAALEAI
jgi:hypothetical protein